MVYVPLSIQMPGYVEELKSRQTLCAEQQAWWPGRDTSNEKRYPLVLGPCGMSTQCTADLQQKISAAIAAPLSNTPQVPPPRPSLRPSVKTSDTHPIKCVSLSFCAVL
jgi:hypothetical protein